MNKDEPYCRQQQSPKGTKLCDLRVPQAMIDSKAAAAPAPAPFNPNAQKERYGEL